MTKRKTAFFFAFKGLSNSPTFQYLNFSFHRHFQVRPLITAMNNNYMQVYSVSRKVNIDESMMRGKALNQTIQPNEANKAWVQVVGKGRYGWLYQ